MAVDLTDSFRLAYEHAASWTPDDLNTAVHTILDRIASAVDDWDASSGEEWAQFTVEGAHILYLRADFPLALVCSGYEVLLSGINVVTVSVEDFRRTQCVMDAVVMEAILPIEVSSGIDPDGFTVYDLWRAAI